MNPLTKIKKIACISLATAAIPALYILSVFLRVGIAEDALFGRNCLMPGRFCAKQFSAPSVPESYGAGTYEYKRNGKTIRVYKQLVNGFQHAYGSALVSLELGETASDYLFRLNEYAESIFCKNSRTLYFFLDTKKDLANNLIGRQIGMEAKALHLSGNAADEFVKSRILQNIDTGKIISHCFDPKVAKLPPPEYYGCNGLPTPQ